MTVGIGLAITGRSLTKLFPLDHGSAQLAVAIVNSGVCDGDDDSFSTAQTLSIEHIKRRQVPLPITNSVC